MFIRLAGAAAVIAALMLGAAGPAAAKPHIVGPFDSRQDCEIDRITAENLGSATDRCYDSGARPEAWYYAVVGGTRHT
ncbi:hypothetical protein DFR70_1076 [Nocardia tenerifensis]|uniref:Uncharacterized protein n=1 Tax=Nocardia tenerifensis TaxID=228006 RepID=A0A318JWG7_9NOCA|nr:hypothetical protein [Nocardia tenerifensis]PXX62140.1 hypothetical protein DFR70_1076 [Nocardia tenerifensis]